MLVVIAEKATEGKKTFTQIPKEFKVLNQLLTISVK